MAVIVSEETGIISAAVGGTITRNLDGTGLRSILHSAMENRRRASPGPSENGRKLYEAADQGLVPGELGPEARPPSPYACFLWFVVRGDSGLGAGDHGAAGGSALAQHGDHERSAQHGRRDDPGSRRQRLVRTARPGLRHRPAGGRGGRQSVPLSDRNVQMPRTSGLELVAIRPARVRLVLERTTSKEVPVRALLGEPPPEFDVYGVSPNPSKVVITGPRSQVQGVREVPTENVSLSGQRESFRTFVNLNIRDSTIHSTPVGPIEVAVQMGPHRTLQTISHIPVAVDDESVLVWPPQISVNILAPPSFGADPQTGGLCCDGHRAGARRDPKARPGEAGSPIQGTPRSDHRSKERTGSDLAPQPEAVIVVRQKPWRRSFETSSSGIERYGPPRTSAPGKAAYGSGIGIDQPPAAPQ